MNDSLLKIMQDQEFEIALNLDKLTELYNILKNYNEEKEKYINLLELQNDLVNNIKNHNIYNNPTLNKKYDIENNKLIEIKNQLNIINNNINNINSNIYNLENKINLLQK